MNKKVLITYASKHGSTAEIAKKIEEDLNQSGFECTTIPVKQVKDLSGFQAVVLGTGLYMGQWQKDAVKFIKQNKALLENQKLWIFTSGPTGEGDPVKLVQNRLYPEGLRAAIEEINPKDVAVFHGNIDPSKLSGFEKWIIGKVNAAIGDFRNWQSISTWATGIANALKS